MIGGKNKKQLHKQRLSKKIKQKHKGGDGGEVLVNQTFQNLFAIVTNLNLIATQSLERSSWHITIPNVEPNSQYSDYHKYLNDYLTNVFPFLFIPVYTDPKLKTFFEKGSDKHNPSPSMFLHNLVTYLSVVHTMNNVFKSKIDSDDQRYEHLSSIDTAINAIFNLYEVPITKFENVIEIDEFTNKMVAVNCSFPISNSDDIYSDLHNMFIQLRSVALLLNKKGGDEIDVTNFPTPHNYASYLDYLLNYLENVFKKITNRNVDRFTSLLSYESTIDELIKHLRSHSVRMPTDEMTLMYNIYDLLYIFSSIIAILKNIYERNNADCMVHVNQMNFYGNELLNKIFQGTYSLRTNDIVRIQYHQRLSQTQQRGGRERKTRRLRKSLKKRRGRGGERTRIGITALDITTYHSIEEMLNDPENNHIAMFNEIEFDPSMLNGKTLQEIADQIQPLWIEQARTMDGESSEAYKNKLPSKVGFGLLESKSYKGRIDGITPLNNQLYSALTDEQKKKFCVYLYTRLYRNDEEKTSFGQEVDEAGPLMEIGGKRRTRYSS